MGSFRMYKGWTSWEVVKKLPLPRLVTTPTDVENIIAFLIENEYVISGEVDEDGVAWFDARTDLD